MMSKTDGKMVETGHLHTKTATQKVANYFTKLLKNGYTHLISTQKLGKNKKAKNLPGTTFRTVCY